ncbi:hypothetical protein M9H77_21895 [Catharanthus roseus]|uniref:Uncharacterized protein n=1 Tax=Catharanthus roseus TaxID=4058 RepID=A0ACC0AQ49_CATRO|nr:hypothetical protein M9H77_21895 [Catharanthus roseus]
MVLCAAAPAPVSSPSFLSCSLGVGLQSATGLLPPTFFLRLSTFIDCGATISSSTARNVFTDTGFMNAGIQNIAAGDLQIVSTEKPPRPPSSSNSSSTALVEYTPPAPNPEDEDLEVKLRRIIECVPVRVSNTSGSSAGSGSGDFHQYRQMRRKEQDRLARMDADFQKRKEIAEFNMRREERLKAAEDRTAKKRMKRQKKKQRKKEKKSKSGAGASASATGDDEQHQKNQSSSDHEQDTDDSQNDN